MSAKRKLDAVSVAFRTRGTFALIDALDEPVSKRTRLHPHLSSTDETDKKAIDRRLERLELLTFEGGWRQRSAEARAANLWVHAPSSDELISAIADAFNSMPTMHGWVPTDVQSIVAEYAVGKLCANQIHTRRHIESLTHSNQFLFTCCGFSNTPVVDVYSLNGSLLYIRSIGSETWFISDGMAFYSGFLIVGDSVNHALRIIDVRSHDPNAWHWVEQSSPFRYHHVCGVQGDSLFVWTRPSNLHQFSLEVGDDGKLQITFVREICGAASYFTQAVSEPGTIVDIHSYTNMPLHQHPKDFVKIIRDHTNVTNIVALPDWPRLLGYSEGRLFVVFGSLFGEGGSKVSIIDPAIGGEITSLKTQHKKNTSNIVAIDIIDGQFLVAAHLGGLITVTRYLSLNPSP